MIRVLVAEDEVNVAAFMQRALSSRGWETSVVGSADEVLRALGQQVWDLLLLDLVMPGASGLDVLTQVLARVPDQPVIVVSAHSGSATKVAALAAGAADYICKPFAIDELLARAEVRMRRGSDAVQYLRRGRLAVDLGRRRAYIDARDVRLTDREFGLLVAMMETEEAGDRVWSREELLSAVWGCSFDSGSNVVDVTVRRLRAKLGVGAIETVRSVGYALAAS